ncbi:MAG: ABC-F family ATP-binding cassette domain-containing protein [Rhabdochlamydiaceae bacterium]
MIQFDDVELSFSGHCVFKDVSFSLQKGERCSFVGRNGSGKSTLFKLIAGELEADRGAISISKNYRIGYLNQHIRFTQATILQEAALGLPEHEREELYRAEKILFGLGFTEEDLDKSPSEFSGGYHLRLHLAKVLVSEPDCLLLDEPTNYLDILSIRWLTNFLKRWPGEFIVISHDRDFLDNVSTHTMGIHREKVKKIKGTTLDFFQLILQDEELHEKSRVKVEKKRAHMQSFVDRFGAKASKAGQAQARVKMLERVPVLDQLNQISELSFAFQEAPFPGRKMLEASHLQFSYTDEPLIDDVTLEIEKGERVAIIGKNGRGKSTLLRLLGGDLTPKKGAVEYSDNTRLGYFGQTHIDRLDTKHTITEEIALANHALNFTQVKGIAGAMMFSGALSDKKISVLSGGEKSRVLLGKIVAKPCNLLLLDEPTHHLDIESIEALIDALEDFSGSVVMVTHSELILRRLNLDKIILCEEARQTLFLGNYDDFLEKVGWGDKASAPKKSAPEPKKDSIKPVEKEIQACEKKIASMTEEQKKNEKLLESGDHSPDLLKTIDKRQKEIEELEGKLYELYELVQRLRDDRDKC